MGMTRLVLGLARDAVAPGMQPEKRERARRILRRLASEHFHLFEQRVRPVEGALFPSSWRSRKSGSSTTGVAVVVLSDSADAEPALAALRVGGAAPDVLVVQDHESQSPGDAICVEAPASWGLAARLIALANSGLLDPYKRLIVVSQDSSSIAPYVSAALNALTDDPGRGLLVDANPSEPTAPERARVQKLLESSDVRLSGAPWLVAPSLSFVSRAFLVQGLRSLQLAPQAFQQQHGTDCERILALLLGALAVEAGCPVEGTVGLEPGGAIAPSASVPSARIIPFYLPQFHPTPENDEWWGEGFTEWTNVTAALPVYRGHQQPLLPADLGFYDLRLDAVRERQSELAAAHGVEGFMYYHYWFAGRQILQTPLESLIRNPAFNQPFCLMWANENWTRSWDGGHHLLLMEQDHETVPAEEFITHALAYMKDPRYLRVDGRAILSVYRAQQIPNIAEVIAAWREQAAAEGIGLHILTVLNPWDNYDPSTALTEFDFDGSMDFPPHKFTLVEVKDTVQWDPRFAGRLFSYPDLVSGDEERLAAGIPETHFPAVMPAWDNTARRQWTSHVWVGANPYTFRRWLAAAVAAVATRPPQHRIVFINAWNEWAEGAVLEPSVRFGRSFLHAIRDVVF